MRGILWALATLWPAVVYSYASTDSLQDADPAQSGYLPNHNMDPNVVGGSSFGILWQKAVENSLEVFYAKTLVYTLNGGSEMVITASNMNIVRIHDSKNGTLISQRQLNPPFLTSDIGCNDIPNYIGVTGTPIIDPATDIIYMMAKGYRGGAASGGMANAVYKMYALQLPSLADAPGFPVTVEGPADNGPERYFIAGTVLQRPSLTSLNGVVVAAFGGHCDMFNYTGVIASVSKTPGVGLVGMFAMEVFPGAPTPQGLVITSENGAGKAGIWQSGFGLATDASRIFAVTGNGKGHANGNVPASGRLPMNTLDECAANFAVSSSGKISLTDYFQPYDYINLDAADQELGSSGLALLDGSTFKTSTVSRIGVTVGKNSKVYIMNADNLGGFKQGSGGTDNVLQILTASNSVFGGVGSYPLEGGYLYFTPNGDVTYAYKMGSDASGKPFFTLAGKTATASAGRAGNGVATVTTYQGKAGTGILWMTDVNVGLRAFKAVPNANGILEAITLPATPGMNKYQRPGFGNGRLFVTSGNTIYCLGSPVNLPITCTDPIDFGNVQTGDTSVRTVSCKANVALTKVNGCTTGDKLFQCNNATLPTGPVAAGTTFSFPVTWNLTQKAINDAQNVSYGKVIPGVEGAVLNLFTTNGVAGYSTQIPVSLTGTVVSSSPFLLMSPTEVDFGGLVLGSSDAANGLSGAASIQNIGNSTLTITGVAWQYGEEPNSEYHNVTYDGVKATFAQGFTASQFVKQGDTIEAGSSVSAPLLFNSSTAGMYSVTVTLWSDGGLDTVILAASAGNPPIASIAISNSEGGWDNSVPAAMHFGNVLAGQTLQKKIRICNVGGSVLTITKSKPPAGAQLTATNPYGELLEGQKIDVGACATGTVAVYAAPVQPNHPSQYITNVWVLNTDGQDALNPGQDFGVREVQTDVTVVSRQIGPTLGDGSGRYQWVGCFKDTGSVGRNLDNQVNNAAQANNNTNEQCQTLCLAQGYAMAGTQYQKECWCGAKIKHPETYTNDSLNLCTFACPGDGTESCGGDNGYMSLYADTTKFDIQAFYASLGKTTSSTSSTRSSTTSSTATGTGISTTTTGTGSLTGTSTSSSTSAPTGSSTASPLNPNQPDIVSNQWKYIGCHQDNVNGVRSLNAISTASDTMTLEACAAYCSKYNYFGTEYSRECYCGYTLNSTALRATESDCSNTCMGNANELCGQGNRLSVYNNQVFQAPPAAPSHVARSGNYGWVGCYTEATNGRALSAFSYADDSMTVDVCAAFCATKGTTMMGIEYARECYCGNTPGAGSVVTDTSGCNMLCKNNTLQYCGAGGKLDMYSLLPPSSLTTSSTSSSVSSTSTSVVTTTSSSSSVTSTSSSSSVTSTSSSSSTVSSTSTSASSTTSPTSSSTSTTGSSSSSLTDKAVTGSSTSTDSSTASTDVSTTTSSSSTSSGTSTATSSSSTTADSSTSSNASTSTDTSATTTSTSDPTTTTSDSSTSTTESSTSTSSTESSTSTTTSTSSLSSTSDSSTSTSASTSSSTSSTASSTSTSSSSIIDDSSMTTSSVSSTESTTSTSSTSSTSSTVSSTSSTTSSSTSTTSTSTSSSLSSTSTSTSSSTSTTSTSTSSSSTSTSSSTTSSSTSTTPSSTSTSSSTTSSSISTSTTSTSLPTTPASISASTTTTIITSVTTTVSPSNPNSTPVQTFAAGYYSIGCYADVSSGHALPLLMTNSSMTPELCLAAANSIGAAKPTPTKFPYVFIEYHGECYAGTSLDFKGSAVSSLYGSNACTDWCSGSRIAYTTNGVVKTSTDLTNRCGGAKQFNLYAVQTSVPFPTTGGPVTTIKTGA